jgi:Icc protein
VRLAWLTDIHLDFVTPPEREALAAEILRRGADGVVITGDIADGRTLIAHLEAMAGWLDRPLWFVLGNHDFYHASIAGVRAAAREVTARHPRLRWLPAAGVIRLADGVALVGHDGWGDARLGDFAGTRVMLNDFRLIDELSGLPRGVLRARLGQLGDEAAAALHPLLAEALTWARHIIVATHVPPFREACWHEGAISSDDWLPFFTCAAVGTVLQQTMQSRPDVQMTVLCGHTHGAGVADLLPNLRVLTGGTDYGAPSIQQLLEL